MSLKSKVESRKSSFLSSSSRCASIDIGDPTRNSQLATRNSQGGAIAIFLASIISVLLLISTTFAARVTISEVAQSSQVDRSEAAYYAAEAGVEEAIRRLDVNRDKEVKQIFPEQYVGSTQVGDEAALLSSSGVWASSPLAIQSATPQTEIGSLSWRNRKVYDTTIFFTDIQVKDESTQLDTTELRRKCAGGTTAGADGKDCDGQDLFGRFEGPEYCWKPNTGDPRIEFTAVSFASGNINNIITEKAITSDAQPNQDLTTGRLTLTSVTGTYSRCINFSVNKNRRYVFRIKPIFPTDVQPVSPNQDVYSVNYKLSLKDSSNNPNYLFIPNDSVLIDVTGQSGNIRRRVIARKIRGGRLLGIFDYILYSGDPNSPLCKIGVVTYSAETCQAAPINNN